MDKKALDFNATTPALIATARKKYVKGHPLIFEKKLTNMDYHATMLHEYT